MGGKSKSSQSTANHQTTENIVNDGDFAGVEGNIAIDESSQSLDYRSEVDNSTDIDYRSDVDNSVKTDIEDSFNTNNSRVYEDSREIDNSVADSFNTNNSINNDGDYAGASGFSLDESSQDVADSYNTDNSVEIDNDGDYAGNHGTITLSDNGAINAANDIARYALDNNGLALNDAFGFGESALNEVGYVSEAALAHAVEQSELFSENLSDMLGATQSANQSVLNGAVAANSNDKTLIADLAKSTSLAGQDLVAKSSERMTLYMSVALGIGFVAIIFFGARNNA